MDRAGASSGLLPDAVIAFLRRSGLARAGETPRAEPLAGGVSSDIWRVELARGALCVKRALPRLRTAQLWEAPVGRNRFERRWIETANRIVPGVAPRVLAADDDAGCFAMEDLGSLPLWKSELAAGRADAGFARAVGERLGWIHAATARDALIAAQFATDASFHALRLEPYLLATARAHADLAARLEALAARTAATRLALVHGDVSPKNILVGPAGPVLLDAECAWYGDPAFDLAFCLNHLLLKCLWVPAASEGFLACFDSLRLSYIERISWEDPSGLEARAASLLPGLLLARVDGKSPVEYITESSQANRVRRVARALISAPPARLSEVREAWRRS
jgi:aminoglycoside phosphotransferase (APT) family kinase protein